MDQSIVPANERLIAEVEAWLDAEEADYLAAHDAWEISGYDGPSPVRGFRCNWDSVKKYWRNGDSKVFVLVVDRQAVGFLDGTDILEIRPDMRRRGYGKILAKFMLEQGYREGRSLIEIGIAPASAEPFWREGMGLTVIPERRGSGGGIYAYKILPRAFDLSADGERVPFAVSFYTEDEGYRSEPAPFARFTGLGERLTDGSVQLPERAYCFAPDVSQHMDYFAKIELGGKTLIFDKAKREECQMLGILRDAGQVFYVDQIRQHR